MRGELEGFWIVARVPRPQLVALGAGLAAPGREDALVARDAAAVLRRAGARTVDQNGVITIPQSSQEFPTFTLNDIAVVMLTGHNDLSLYRDAARLGIAAFLVKPAGPSTLKAALEEALAGRRVSVPRLDD